MIMIIPLEYEEVSVPSRNTRNSKVINIPLQILAGEAQLRNTLHINAL